jgi:hypothetical protein
MHLRGAGIGEADVDHARNQGPHQAFRTVHRSPPVGDFPQNPLKINHSSCVSSKVKRDIAAIAALMLPFFNRNASSSVADWTVACEIATNMACVTAEPDI